MKLKNVFLILWILIVADFLGAGLVGTARADVNAWGVKLPADAAPASEQVLTLPCQQGKHMDISAHFYDSEKSCGAVWMFEPLVNLNENNEVVPAAAEKWERDGDKWTFHLRKDAVWSDGSPVTAADFEAALKRHLDPKTGGSWTWYYSDIKDSKAVTEGEKPPAELPVYAVDDYTLVIETNGEVPYFDQIMAYPSSVPLPRKMLEKYGENWNTNPETCLSNGPYKMASYKPGQEIVLVPNTLYNGPNKPYVEKFIMKPGDGTSDFPAYQAGEVDGLFADQDTTPISPSTYRFVKNDTGLKAELYDYPYYATRYIFFNTTVKPWDDIRVREAVTRALDGDAMIKVIYDGLGARSYGMLPIGFPAYVEGANDEFQSYDPEMAKKLLAEAGYPDGKGFPEVELWVKTYEQALPKTAEMAEQMLKKNLGITIKIRPVESKFFNSSMSEGMIDFGIQNWQYDYVDPSNFLNVWHPELGRHKEWNNAEYNALIEKATAWKDGKEREALYAQANNILSKTYGGAFLYHMGQAQMWKPNVKGIPTDSAGNKRVPYYFLGMYQIYKAK